MFKYLKKTSALSQTPFFSCFITGQALFLHKWLYFVFWQTAMEAMEVTKAVIVVVVEGEEAKVGKQRKKCLFKFSVKFEI